MNKRKLEMKLKEIQIDPSAYTLNGGLPNEVYCLGQQNGQWEVYYSERGIKTNLKKFEKEEEACHFFYNWLKSSLM